MFVLILMLGQGYGSAVCGEGVDALKFKNYDYGVYCGRTYILVFRFCFLFHSSGRPQ